MYYLLLLVQELFIGNLLSICLETNISSRATKSEGRPFPYFVLHLDSDSKNQQSFLSNKKKSTFSITPT